LAAIGARHRCRDCASGEARYAELPTTRAIRFSSASKRPADDQQQAGDQRHYQTQDWEEYHHGRMLL
jgi:hypothetical protein